MILKFVNCKHSFEQTLYNSFGKHVSKDYERNGDIKEKKEKMHVKR